MYISLKKESEKEETQRRHLVQPGSGSSSILDLSILIQSSSRVVSPSPVFKLSSLQV